MVAGTGEGVSGALIISSGDGVTDGGDPTIAAEDGSADSGVISEFYGAPTAAAGDTGKRHHLATRCRDYVRGQRRDDLQLRDHN